MGQPRSLVPSLVTWSNFSMRRASRCIPSLYKWWTPGYSSSSNMFPTHRQTRDEFIVCEIFLSTKLTLSIDNFIKEDGSGVHLGLHFSGREVVGISDTIVLFKKPMVVSYRLSIVITDYWAIYNHPAAICHWLISDTQINRGWVSLGQSLVRKRLTNVSQILKQYERHMGCRMQKKSCGYLLPFDHNARMWQTDKPQNGNIDIIGQITFSDVA